jgi:hypothetical protein
MAAPDTTAIDKTIDEIVYLDTTVNGKKPGVTALRAAYKAVTKWAKEQIQNASTWRRIADGKGSVDETDTIFHTGRTIIGGSQDDNSGAPLQVRGVASIDGLVAPNGDQQPIGTATYPGLGFLRFLANLIPGLSEFSLVNINLAGDGFAFWQMLTTTSKRLLMVVRRSGVAIGTDNPDELLHVAGRVKMFGWVAGGAAPTCSVMGTALSTIAMSSTATDQAGVFTIVTGSNPIAGQMARISFSNKVARVPTCVLISASSTSAGPHLGKVVLYPESSSALILTSSDAGALPANVTLSFFYQVII